MRAGRPLPGCWRGSLPPRSDGRQTRPTRSTPGRDIGHVHLKVADLDRALDFYVGVLGFELMQRFGDRGRVRLRRRLSPPHRAQHLAVEGRLAAAAGDHRPLPHRDPLPDPARRSPTRCAACARPGSRSTAPPTTGSARRSTSATPTRTGSSSTGTAREEEWPRDPATGGRRDVHRAARPRRPARRARRLDSAPCAAVAQLARASACHAEGRGFESHQPLFSGPPSDRDRRGLAA